MPAATIARRLIRVRMLPERLELCRLFASEQSGHRERFAYERQTRTQPDEERNDPAGGRTRHERIVEGDNEEPRARACRRKQEQRSHSLVVAEADVNEAMREVVTSSSPDRTSLGEPDEDHERRVEDRQGE